MKSRRLTFAPQDTVSYQHTLAARKGAKREAGLSVPPDVDIR
jgi:hypothetical protein